MVWVILSLFNRGEPVLECIIHTAGFLNVLWHHEVLWINLLAMTKAIQVLYFIFCSYYCIPPGAKQESNLSMWR